MTPDELIDHLQIFIGDCYEREAIASTVARLPPDVVDWVLTDIHFCCPPGCDGTAFKFSIPAPLAGKTMQIVYISPDVFDRSERECQKVIAHEVAHHRLGHGGTPDGHAYNLQELQVHELLKSWGIWSNLEKIRLFHVTTPKLATRILDEWFDHSVRKHKKGDKEIEGVLVFARPPCIPDDDESGVIEVTIVDTAERMFYDWEVTVQGSSDRTWCIPAAVLDLGHNRLLSDDELSAIMNSNASVFWNSYPPGELTAKNPPNTLFGK